MRRTGYLLFRLLLKLNLCSQFDDSESSEDPFVITGECVGKTEIDSYSGKKLGIASTSSMTLWERRTKDSIWRFGSSTGGLALGSNDKGYIRVKPKNHRSLALWMSSSTTEYISYTYRF